MGFFDSLFGKKKEEKKPEEKRICPRQEKRGKETGRKTDLPSLRQQLYRQGHGCSRRHHLPGLLGPRVG